MMQASSSHNLAPPRGAQTPRRKPSPAPPPSAIDIPEPVYGHESTRRSPSPLRNSFSPADDSFSDEGPSTDDPWGASQRPASPAGSSASFQQMASSFTQRLGFSNLMSPASSSTHLPSDAELEAEAERERDRSRKEAERILMAEAAERRAMEERVLGMLNPPNRSQTLPPPQPIFESSPGDSPNSKSERRKSGTPGWWDAAKQRLTPTKEPKEPLTPAQQIILESKEREKAAKKEREKGKGKERERKKSNDWPGAPADVNDPAFAPLTPPRRPTAERAAGSNQSSPALSVQRSIASLPASLAPSPAGKSREREPPPLYAQFTPQGTLDTPGTLLAVARRFEKLERWTVSHVRALEERMGDVERWLVDREHERTASSLNGSATSHKDDNAANEALEGVREEMAELQGRIGELGREMARLATQPANLSNGPSRASPAMSAAPPTSSSFAQPQPAPSSLPSPYSALTQSPSHQRSPSQNQSQSTPRRVASQTHSRTASLSPPFVPPTAQREPPKSRLPYPTGDYAPISALSPPSSPPGIAGLPPLTHRDSSSSLTSGVYARAMSPPTNFSSPMGAQRGESVSPTPRKRYTVALKSSPDSTPATLPRSDSPAGMTSEDEDDAEETIGKSSGRRYLPGAGNGTGRPGGRERERSVGGSFVKEREEVQESPSAGGRQGRARPVSMMPLGSSVTPLRIRSRSVASARSASPDDVPSTASSASGTFVDPYKVRAQEREERTKIRKATAPTVVAGKPRAKVRDMAKFFDQEVPR
ncbi:hypothetical protein PENSPDRAFT_733012 [Peniophora sp. CONT]|nr:hypothetical protein PENSPDRAFT_733012 [Peniophora sp. CONT]